MIAYVDSSVLLRHVFGQSDQLAEWTMLDDAFASELIRVETLRTIDRAALRVAMEPGSVAELRAGALEIVARLHVVPMTGEVLERAGDPFPTPLGTLDAIHLSTALALRSTRADLSFATHDHELATAARSFGFRVIGV